PPASSARPASAFREPVAGSRTTAFRLPATDSRFPYFHRLFAPRLDAAIGAMETESEPVATGREGSGVDARAEADGRMVRIGGNLPERRHARIRDAVVGTCDHRAIERDLDGLQADAVLECPAFHVEPRTDPRAGRGHVDPCH